MTTEEFLWDSVFEQESQNNQDSYNYREEWAMERYYEDKELFDRSADHIRTAS